VCRLIGLVGEEHDETAISGNGELWFPQAEAVRRRCGGAEVEPAAAVVEAGEDAGLAAALLVEIGDLVAQQQIEPAPPARDEPAKPRRDAGAQLAEPPAEEPGRQR